MTRFLVDGPAHPLATVMVAHGAGAPMDSAFMNTMAELLSARDLRVVRFEFPYMAARRAGTGRPAPPRAEKMAGFYAEAARAQANAAPLLIGGKSYGGRVASLAAQELFDAHVIHGLALLGYPFHPPGKVDNLRTGHLVDMTVPALICQGERDPFGGRDEVAGYGLPSSFTMNWAGDGDHDLKPRRKSGLTVEQNLGDAADAIAAFAQRISTSAGTVPTIAKSI